MLAMAVALSFSDDNVLLVLRIILPILGHIPCGWLREHSQSDAPEGRTGTDSILDTAANRPRHVLKVPHQRQHRGHEAMKSKYDCLVIHF